MARDPLPLAASGPYARLATITLACYAAAAVSAIALAVFSPVGGGLEPCACLVFLYASAVVGEQVWSLQWPRGDAGVYLIMASALAGLLAPTVWPGHDGDTRLASVCLSALIYGYMVRVGKYKVPKTSLEGKVYLVTGCNAGIGLPTAEQLARGGAKVVFACRNEERAREAMKKLIVACNGDVKEEQLVFIAPLDLGSVKSIKNFATKFRLLASMRGLELHGLVLNAGAMFRTRTLSQDGIESTLASNHFGHFLLTQLLLPNLKAAEKSGQLPRIVVVGSSHSFSYDTFDFSEAAVIAEADREKWQQKPYELFHQYGQSKFANLLYATELSRRLRESGSRIPVCVIHPGSVNTEIARDIPEAMFKLYKIIMPAMYLLLKTPRQGCQNTVFAAVEYGLIAKYEASSSFLWIDRLAVRDANEAGCDAAAAKELWSISEKLMGVA